jgi:hypothetical protein
MEGYSKNYKIEGNGSVLEIAFFCAIEDYSFVTELPSSLTLEEAVKKAWNEARKNFNRSHECGAWVC